ncbi:MAG: FIST C-terminal domain-containing protein [Proteobacteria bacterium]|nr:FIST C-terminal domain-containing protein [Pseudomonadota bacterium]
MKAGTGYCNEKDAFFSGEKIAQQAVYEGDLYHPDFAIAFCHGLMDHYEFYNGLRKVLGNDVPIIGGSAIGIITNKSLSYEGYPSGVIVIESGKAGFQIVSETGLEKDEKETGKRFAEKLSQETNNKLLFILYDSVKNPGNGNAPPILNASSLLIEGIEEIISPDIPIVGAGVLGDYDIKSTNQFCGFNVETQSIAGIIFSGDFQPYYRIMHGCVPLDGVYHRITKMEGSTIYELDNKPIVKMIDDIYGNQAWRTQNPVSLLTIGVNHGGRFEEPKESDYVNRLIIGALPNGEGICIFEPDLKNGTEIQFMLRDSGKMIDSAKINSKQLMDQIAKDRRKPVAGIYIDCAGRAANYLNISTEEAYEVQKVFNEYNTPLLGFYSGVEIAPLLQKSRGLDWTGVLLVLAGN